MSLVAWYAVVGSVQAALAFWVILAQPRRVLNWVVGVFLLLWAGSGVIFQLWREATTSSDRLLFSRVGNLYEAPTFLLILLVIDRLMLRTPRPRAWKWLLVASGAALVVFLVAHATATTAEPHTALAVVNASAGLVAQNAAVILAVAAANDARRSTLQRKQAALFGLAFALLLAHSGAAATVLLLRGALVLAFVAILPLAVLALVGLGTSLYAVVRLPTPFRGGARAAVAVSIVLALAIGVLSHVSLTAPVPSGGRVVVVSGFALVLAVALLRYDLAAALPEQRRRLHAVAPFLLALCVAAILAVATWSLLGRGALTVGVTLAMLLAPIALLVTPLKRLPAWVTRRVLLHPRDPEALRERVRVYAGALRAATGSDGRIVAAAGPTLAALRAQLGLGQRDHDLLMSMGGDQRAGGIVAYRLALVGAAADSERLDDAQLRNLRDDLGLTERDHALVMEHVRAGADSLSVGARFLGRYHVLRRLNEGGLGEVWLAHDLRSDLDVVLKQLGPHDRRDVAAMKRVREEFRAASVVDHPNIVAVRGLETVGDEAYLVMEYMRGGSLADLLRAKGRLPEAEVLRIATDILAALAALHARGFVHRDVKPGNILFDALGAAKLGDFNVARELVSGETIGQDGPRGPVGTFAYMPLDQARGLTPQPASDLYSLGATMYEALAGEPLMDLVGLSHTEAIARIAAQAPPALVPHASPAVSAAIVRSLARSPDGGFADAAAMSAAITRVGTREGSGQHRRRRRG